MMMQFDNVEKQHENNSMFYLLGVGIRASEITVQSQYVFCELLIPKQLLTECLQTAAMAFVQEVFYPMFSRPTGTIPKWHKVSLDH